MCRDELSGNWQRCHVCFNRVLESDVGELDHFHEVIDALTELRDDAENAFSGASSRSKLDTAETSFRRVRTTVKSSCLKFCKPRGFRSAERPPSLTSSADNSRASVKEHPKLDPARPELGPARSFGEAQLELGPNAAIPALAVTFQKTEDGLVLNPGAYLCAIFSADPEASCLSAVRYLRLPVSEARL